MTPTRLGGQTYLHHPWETTPFWEKRCLCLRCRPLLRDTCDDKSQNRNESIHQLNLQQFYQRTQAYLVCVFQKRKRKKHKVRKLEILSPPDRIGESGAKKINQGQRDTNLTRVDRSKKYSYEPGFHFYSTNTKDQIEVEYSVSEVECNLTCPELEGWSRTEREISQGWTPASDL